VFKSEVFIKGLLVLKTALWFRVTKTCGDVFVYGLLRGLVLAITYSHCCATFYL